MLYSRSCERLVGVCCGTGTAALPVLQWFGSSSYICLVLQLLVGYSISTIYYLEVEGGELSKVNK
jgi:hypothetical protein